MGDVEPQVQMAARDADWVRTPVEGLPTRVQSMLGSCDFLLAVHRLLIPMWMQSSRKQSRGMVPFSC